MRRLGYVAVTLATAVLAPSGRSLMAAAASGRLAYGAATLLAPRWVAGRWAAPESGSVMNLRGFGGQHVALGVYTLFAARSRRLARPALLLNAGVEVCDGVAGGFEVHERGFGNPMALGAVLLPAVNLAAWLTALRRLERQLSPRRSSRRRVRRFRCP